MINNEAIEENIFVIKMDCGDCIILSENTIFYPKNNLFAKEGIYCYQNKEGVLEADSCVTVFYDINETNLNNYLYFEQDPPEIALHNYLNLIAAKEQNETSFIMTA